MKMFSELSSVLDSVGINISLQKKGDIISVMIVPKGEVKEGTSKKISPLMISGTAEELDDKFLTTIQAPLERTAESFNNISQYEKSLSDATNSSKKETEKALPKMSADEKKEKAEKLFDEGEVLVTESKLEEAVKKFKEANDLKKLKKYSERADYVEKLMKVTEDDPAVEPAAEVKEEPKAETAQAEIPMEAPADPEDAILAQAETERNPVNEDYQWKGDDKFTGFANNLVSKKVVTIYGESVMHGLETLCAIDKFPSEYLQNGVNRDKISELNKELKDAK